MAERAARACNIYVLNDTHTNNCGVAATVIHAGKTGGGWNGATLEWSTEPGQVFVLWVGPDVYAPPLGGYPQEFAYVMAVCGHMPSVVGEAPGSWGEVKSLFR